jgi:hypothetical protein
MIPPMRTTQAFALFMGVVVYLLLTQLDMTLLRKLIIFLAVIVAIYQSQALNAIFYGDNLRSQEDFAFANRIAERVSELGQGEIPNQPVIYIGKLDFIKSNPEGPIIKTKWGGTSYFYHTPRATLYMKYLGFDYKTATVEQQKHGMDLAVNMPVWPDKDSVALKDGLIIVKLSKN